MPRNLLLVAALALFLAHAVHAEQTILCGWDVILSQNRRLRLPQEGIGP